MRRPAVAVPLVVLAATLVVLPAASAPAARARPSDARLGAAIDAWAKPFVDHGHLSGQLLVTRHGKVIVERSYGFANVELRVPVTPETIFNIASITKPMTVAIALRLIESGAIREGDSIARWLPDFPEARTITIGHLLRHRSGIPHEIVPDSEAVRPRTAAEMVERAARRPLDFPPGSKRAYSSGGFTVLARILELASGKDYQALLEEHVLRPVGMTHTLHTDGVRMLPNRAACYVPGPDGVENAAFQDLSGLVGAGSVWSTARDIDRFVQAVVAGKLGEGTRQSWVRGGTLAFNGQTSGFRAYAEWDSATGLGVTFCGNVVSGAPSALKTTIVRLAAGEPPLEVALPALATTPTPAERLRHMEGTFQLESGVRLKLWTRGSQILVNDWPLLPTADGAFFSPRDYGLVRPVDGADGRIERLDWTQEGTVYPAPRVSDS